VVGLLIVSSHSSFVRGVSAAATVAASVVSTVRWPMPERSSTARARPSVPPYTACGMRISSPLRRIDSTTPWMAAMPDAVMSAASPPSSSASASSSASWVGFE
jgi:hypothetical protein